MVLESSIFTQWGYTSHCTQDVSNDWNSRLARFCSGAHVTKEGYCTSFLSEGHFLCTSSFMYGILISFKGHKWKQGMWSKEEIDILMNNIERYLKVHHENVCTFHICWWQEYPGSILCVNYEYHTDFLTENWCLYNGKVCELVTVCPPRPGVVLWLWALFVCTKVWAENGYALRMGHVELTCISAEWLGLRDLGHEAVTLTL